ncbi:IS4 family transposase [Cupriavidus necator]
MAHCPLDAVGQNLPGSECVAVLRHRRNSGGISLAKKARPKTPVTLNQMIRLVASLGGFLGRKSDGEPGAKTIWIGMQRTMHA